MRLARGARRGASAEARAAGRTIAFANGCFDLLHVGHIRYLEAAAQEADVLVVAINDDESVRQLKGDGAADSSGGRPGRARGRAPLRRLRRHLSRADCRSAARRAAARRPLQGHRLHRGLRARARRSSQAYGGRTAIVGDPKDHSTRDLLARIARGVQVNSFLIVRLGSLGDVDSRDSRRGGAAAGISERARRLDG